MQTNNYKSNLWINKIILKNLVNNIASYKTNIRMPHKN